MRIWEGLEPSEQIERFVCGFPWLCRPYLRFLASLDFLACAFSPSFFLLLGALKLPKMISGYLDKAKGRAKRTEKQNLTRMGNWKPLLETLL